MIKYVEGTAPSLVSIMVLSWGLGKGGDTVQISSGEEKNSPKWEKVLLAINNLGNRSHIYSGYDESLA